MSIFERLNGQPQMTMQQLRQDPVGMAKQAGYDIPQELAGNAQAMVQHLFQTGQIKGPKLQQAMQMIRQMTGK